MGVGCNACPQSEVWGSGKVWVGRGHLFHPQIYPLVTLINPTQGDAAPWLCEGGGCWHPELVYSLTLCSQDPLRGFLEIKMDILLQIKSPLLSFKY